MAIKRDFYLNRFAVQLPLLFFAAGFAVILLFCGVLYFAVSNVLLSETIDHTQSMLNMSSVNISTYIDRLWSESNLFANDPDLKKYLASENSDLKKSLEQRISLLLENDPCIKSIVAVSKDGRILSNEKDLDMAVSADMMQEKWYLDAMHTDMPILTGARMQRFSTDKNNWVISVSTEVTDEAGNNTGVLLVDMNYSVIEGLLQNLELGQGGFVFLVNDKRELVYHEDTDYFQDSVMQRELIALIEQGNRYDRSENFLTAQTRVENAGWTMMTVVYLDNLLVLRQHLFETVLLTGVLLLAMMLIIGTLFTRRLTRPIRKMEKKMLEIEKLSEMEPDKSAFYEMEIFSANYNRMIHRIRKLLEELSQNEEILRQLELQALTDQIKPHFLYNTLDTIVWMAEFNDCHRVIALTKSLATFFRLSLSGGRSVITIKEELEHVRQYLFIQKERYEDRLSYEISADDQILSCFVPKLILQPLAENSIYHGLKPLNRPGHINISALQEGAQIYLRISDNGVGFDTSSVSSAGVGLHNVRERIALYYRDTGKVTVTSAPGEGCTVTIMIPTAGPSDTAS